MHVIIIDVFSIISPLYFISSMLCVIDVFIDWSVENERVLLLKLLMKNGEWTTLKHVSQER